MECLLLKTVTLTELVNTTLGIDESLLSSEIRVAGRAGVDRHCLLGGTGVDDIAASAGDSCLSVFRMDILLHFSEPFLRNQDNNSTKESFAMSTFV